MKNTPNYSKSPRPAHPIVSAAIVAPKAGKAVKASTQSRDLREDRGARQMKTVHNPQSLPHGR